MDSTDNRILGASELLMHCPKCEKPTLHLRETERSDPDDPVTYYKCEYCNFITL